MLKRYIEELIIAHPKVAVALVALIVAIVEAVSGVTVTVGNEVASAVS